jgi:hypothetical protein
MSDLDMRQDGPEDMIRPAEPSRDPEYLAWREAKIRGALEAARAAPERSVPQREVWKKFGLEY